MSGGAGRLLRHASMGKRPFTCYVAVISPSDADSWIAARVKRLSIAVDRSSSSAVITCLT